MRPQCAAGYRAGGFLRSRSEPFARRYLNVETARTSARAGAVGVRAAAEGQSAHPQDRLARAVSPVSAVNRSQLEIEPLGDHIIPDG